MTTIIDALAKHGIRGFFHMMTTPQASVNSCPTKAQRQVEDGYLASKDEAIFATIEKGINLEKDHSVRPRKGQALEVRAGEEQRKRKGRTSKQISSTIDPMQRFCAHTSIRRVIVKLGLPGRASRDKPLRRCRSILSKQFTMEAKHNG
ncbi:Nn.00g060690.m01.CDS01 [Neocucurbitaria sp. VM-36]